MPDLKESMEEGYEFRDGYMREFDMALHMMQPSDRAGYLHSAYVRISQGNFPVDIMEEMVQLLLKWSTDRRNFAGHAKKLQVLALSARTSNKLADHVRDSDVRDVRGDSRSLVSKVLSSPPGPLSAEE